MATCGVFFHASLTLPYPLILLLVSEYCGRWLKKISQQATQEITTRP